MQTSICFERTQHLVDTSVTCYKNRDEAPKLCCMEYRNPEPWSGQIGGFNYCPELSAYLLTIGTPNSDDPEMTGYTALCVKHTAEVREVFPADVIVSVEQFPTGLVHSGDNPAKEA